MSKVIPLANQKERDEAERFWLELQAAADRNAPGWMVEESKLQPVLDRIERALDAYDRKHNK